MNKGVYTAVSACIQTLSAFNIITIYTQPIMTKINFRNVCKVIKEKENNVHKFPFGTNSC